MRNLLTLLFVFVPVVSVSAAEDSAFTGDKREFRKLYKTIALSPVDAQGGLVVPADVAAAIEEEITERFERRGHKVLPSVELKRIRETMAEQVGGLPAAATTSAERKKLRAVHTHALRELWYRHDIDAVATVRIRIVDAQFAKGRAEWDGAKQKVEAKGRDRGYSGDIKASSIALAVFDASGRLLYENWGGLELLQKRVDAQLLPLPAEQHFADIKRARAAAKESVSEI